MIFDILDSNVRNRSHSSELIVSSSFGITNNFGHGEVFERTKGEFHSHGLAVVVVDVAVVDVVDTLVVDVVEVVVDDVVEVVVDDVVDVLDVLLVDVVDVLVLDVAVEVVVDDVLVVVVTEVADVVLVLVDVVVGAVVTGVVTAREVNQMARKIIKSTPHTEAPAVSPTRQGCRANIPPCSLLRLLGKKAKKSLSLC